MADEPIGIIELEDNLGDAEKPPVLPKGNYVGEIQDVQVPTSQKGNEYFAIAFKISSDQVPADIAEHFDDGAVLYYNRIVVPRRGSSGYRRALYNLRMFLEAIGLDSNTTSIDPNEWMGCQAKLRVVNNMYQGEQQANIQSIDAVDEVAPAAKSRRGRK